MYHLSYILPLPGGKEGTLDAKMSMELIKCIILDTKCLQKGLVNDGSYGSSNAKSGIEDQPR